ncbi:hypothetical protein GCM10023320_06160 [Pseudonocardia adelaidensis]|uniref:Uncharacterized protein n=1 Tax=Pseudonocardia adelaidensis TaxID=648754 RepID=A0ABP9NB95_9PSEU
MPSGRSATRAADVGAAGLLVLVEGEVAVMPLPISRKIRNSFSERTVGGRHGRVKRNSVAPTGKLRSFGTYGKECR